MSLMKGVSIEKTLKEDTFSKNLWKYIRIWRWHVLLALLFLHQKEVARREKRSLPLRHQFYLRFPSISPTTTDKPFYLQSPSHVSRPIRTRKKKIWRKNGETGEKGKNRVPRTRLHIALECLLSGISPSFWDETDSDSFVEHVHEKS